MNAKTLEAYNEIKRAVASGQERIASITFTFCFGRAATAAAFRKAVANGIIEFAYRSAAGTNVWQPAGTKAAITEAANAIHH